MNGTPPEVEERLRVLMQRRTGLQRLQMCAEMVASARTMRAMGLEAEGLVPGTVAFRERVFLALYGQDFTPEERERWRGRLRARWAGQRMQPGLLAGRPFAGAPGLTEGAPPTGRAFPPPAQIR